MGCTPKGATPNATVWSTQTYQIEIEIEIEIEIRALEASIEPRT